jgi:hypothetical protein
VQALALELVQARGLVLELVLVQAQAQELLFHRLEKVEQGGRSILSRH